jgi:flagellar biosynthesis GTPase FlhF
MSCSVKEYCVNNEIKCWLCKADNEGCSELYYRATDNNKAPKIHPLKQEEKDKIKKERKEEKTKNALEKNKEKSKQTMAALTERKAQKIADKVILKNQQKEFSKPTANSGRRDRDVDHIIKNGQIRLDSKHQSKRINPQVNLIELDQAISKSIKFKSDLGGLILWNKDQRSVVVFDYQDWLKWEAERGTNIEQKEDN